MNAKTVIACFDKNAWLRCLEYLAEHNKQIGLPDGSELLKIPILASEKLILPEDVIRLICTYTGNSVFDGFARAFQTTECYFRNDGPEQHSIVPGIIANINTSHPVFAAEQTDAPRLHQIDTYLLQIAERHTALFEMMQTDLEPVSYAVT